MFRNFHLFFSLSILFTLSACTKNNIEVHGRFVHSKDGKPDVGTGVELRTDLLWNAHSRVIGSGRTDSGGNFIIYARARPNGRYYIYAVGGKGESILLRDGSSFSAVKNGVTDVGDIPVSW
jgi:hypothetical protein